MEKQTVFIKRYIDKGELPKEGWVLTPSGAWMFHCGKFKCPHDGTIQQGINEWLNEIELPSEDEVKAELTHPVNMSVNVSTLLRDMYEHGLNRAYNFILNKLKGE